MRSVQVEFIECPDGREPVCKTCGSDVEWQDCQSCEEGYSYHDCGEDCCSCLDPVNNMVCDACEGTGGWYLCLGCKPERTDNDRYANIGDEKNG